MADNENQDANDDWEAAMAEQEAVEAAAADVGETASSSDNQPTNDPGGESADEAVQKADFDTLTPESGEELSVKDASLDVILDIPVTISLEVGSTKISIRNLLKLNQGSVVELDRLAGEPLDVLVNNTLIAHAEVVVVNERYGIRLTDVISAAERIQKLK